MMGKVGTFANAFDFFFLLAGELFTAGVPDASPPRRPRRTSVIEARPTQRHFQLQRVARKLTSHRCGHEHSECQCRVGTCKPCGNVPHQTSHFGFSA